MTSYRLLTVGYVKRETQIKGGYNREILYGPHHSCAWYRFGY